MLKMCGLRILFNCFIKAIRQQRYPPRQKGRIAVATPQYTSKYHRITINNLTFSLIISCAEANTVYICV